MLEHGTASPGEGGEKNGKYCDEFITRVPSVFGANLRECPPHMRVGIRISPHPTPLVLNPAALF